MVVTLSLCVSEDHTYLEYSASPSSFLSLSIKKLLELSQPESAHWPKVEWNWRIIIKIILANMVLLLILLLLEGIFFNCKNNKLGRAQSRTSYHDIHFYLCVSTYLKVCINSIIMITVTEPFSY